MLVTDVRSLFFNIGNFATAARLKDIQARLADELRTVERLVAGSEPGLITLLPSYVLDKLLELLRYLRNKQRKKHLKRNKPRETFVLPGPCDPYLFPFCSLGATMTRCPTFRQSRKRTSKPIEPQQGLIAQHGGSAHANTNGIGPREGSDETPSRNDPPGSRYLRPTHHSVCVALL